MKRFILFGLLVFSSKLGFAGLTPQAVLIPSSVNYSTAPAVGTAGTVTVTTPTATGAYSSGYYNYLTNVHIEMYAKAAQVGGAGVPNICTSTNLPNNPQWFFPVVVTSGTVTIVDMRYANPLQATQGSQITVTCPAVSNASWNINIGAYTTN